MKKIQKISCVVFLLLLFFTTSNAVYAYEDEIGELQNQISVHNEKLDSAHLMAQSARNLGIEESDEIILTAKEIWHATHNDKKELEDELSILNGKRNQILKEEENKIKKQQENRVYIGDYKLTGYCPCYSCSEGWGSQTASGNRAVEGVTIAADTRKLPLGTRVYIEGVGERVVQDVGGAIKGNKIDVYVNNHSDCYKSAYNTTSKVYILK